MNISLKFFKTALFILLFAYAILPSCKKVDNKPSVTTDPAFWISRTSTHFKGSYINEGSDTVISYGFCWSIKSQPTYDDHRTGSDYMINGTYGTVLSGLSPATTYYVRAYATTVNGKIYGNQESFTTKPATSLVTFNPALTYQTVSDIDGNIYKTIKIGTQEWMAENLKTSSLNDGTTIPVVTDDDIWDNLKSPGLSWYNNSETDFKNIYGGYYNWYSVSSGKLCPVGWHVSSENDWITLKVFLGMTPEDAAGGYYTNNLVANKIKETGTLNWVGESKGETNESGFTALPGGSRISSITFIGEGESGYWWSSSLINGKTFSHWVVQNETNILRREITSTENGSFGFNVRCVKD